MKTRATFLTAFLLLVFAGGCDSSEVSSNANARLTGDGVFFGNHVGASGNRVIVATRDGSAYVFGREGPEGSWEQEARFGNLGVEVPGEVTLNEDYAFVGAPDGLNSHGAVHIFKQGKGGYSKQTTFYAGRDLENRLGSGMAVQPDLLAVTSAEKQGAVYLLKLADGGWKQAARLTAEDPSRRIGTSVAACEGRVAVSGAGRQVRNEVVGAIHLFAKQGGTWSQEEAVSAQDAEPNSGFGRSVACAEEYVATGTPGKGESAIDAEGAVYVFEKSSKSWQQQEKLTLEDANRRDHFGRVVDFSPSGDYLIASSIYRDEGRGAAYVFHHQPGGTWQQQAKLTAPERQGSAFFGEDVAITDRYAVVGAPGENGESGAAYVFERDGTDWTLAQ